MMKMGIIWPRGGIEPTSLAFCAIVLMITPPRLPAVTPFIQTYLSMLFFS